MTPNKLTRKLAAQKVLRRKNAALGFSGKEAIPLARAKAITAGGYRISQRSDRKQFGKSSKKRIYGHFSGMSRAHLPPQEARERAEIWSHPMSDLTG